MINRARNVKLRNACCGILLCLSFGLISGCSTLLSHSQSGHEKDVHAKRSLGTALDDNAIVGKIEAKIRAVNEQLAAMVQVDSYNKIVLLTGRVPDKGFINSALEIASRTPGVRQVHSEITKGEPTTISNYWYDAWLTTKVKSQLTMTSNAPSSKTKVRSFAGYVYLMGVMTTQEAKNAIYVTSRIPGAKKVISMIETIDADGRAMIAQPTKRQQQLPETAPSQNTGNMGPGAQPASAPGFGVISSDSGRQTPMANSTEKSYEDTRFQQRPLQSNQAQSNQAQSNQDNQNNTVEATPSNQRDFYNDYQTNTSPQPRSVQSY